MQCPTYWMGKVENVGYDSLQTCTSHTVAAACVTFLFCWMEAKKGYSRCQTDDADARGTGGPEAEDTKEGRYRFTCSDYTL